jgi:hypothetical protein
MRLLLVTLRLVLATLPLARSLAIVVAITSA